VDSKFLVRNGLWGVGLVAAYLVGSSQNSTKAPEDSTTSAPRSLSIKRAGDPSSDPSSSSSRTRTSRSEERGELSQIFEISRLSNIGIEALTKEALNDPNPVKRRLAFSRLLEGMTVENSAAIRDELVSLGAGRQEWQDFNYAWGAIAGQDAFTNSTMSEKRDLEAVISGWAATDPAGAIAMLANLPEDIADQKSQLERGIVSGLADRDQNEAAKYVYSLASEGREDAPRLMGIVASEVLRKDGSESAARWTESLADGLVKGSAMNEVAGRYVREDPEAASSWIAQFAAEEYAASAVAEVGKEWAEKEPLTAVTWLDNLPEGQGQKNGLNAAFGDWEDKDPVAAGEYLLTMAESPKRDAAIKGFAEGVAWQDPQIALAWALDITNPQIRGESITRVGHAYFRRNPEAAQEWLTNSGFSAEMQNAIKNPPRRRGR
jgi:hypothetical protein